MARVRAIDTSGDWLFGKGRNDYKRDNLAIVQNIGTRLNSFLGDCFFDMGAGIDWFNLLGSKELLTLELSISTVILNTADVTGLLQLSTELNPTTRVFSVSYRVSTTFSVTGSVFEFDINGLI